MGISGFPTKPVGSPDQPDFFICLLISGEAIPNNSYVQFAQSNVTSGNADEIFKKADPHHHNVLNFFLFGIGYGLGSCNLVSNKKNQNNPYQ